MGAIYYLNNDGGGGGGGGDDSFIHHPASFSANRNRKVEHTPTFLQRQLYIAL